MFILYEITKLKDSYWYPWLRVLPITKFTSFWDPKEIEEFQVDWIIKQSEDDKQIILEQWEQFKIVLEEWPSIFPERFVDPGLFLCI